MNEQRESLEKWIGKEIVTSAWTYVYHDIDFLSTDASGKWLIFLSPAFRDEWWERVAKATAEGKLGPAAKVSNAPQGKRYCVCVYCKDSGDIDDVMRVREGLRSLGVIKPIPYKPCWMTRAGKSGSAFSA